MFGRSDRIAGRIGYLLIAAALYTQAASPGSPPSWADCILWEGNRVSSLPANNKAASNVLSLIHSVRVLHVPGNRVSGLFDGDNGWTDRDDAIRLRCILPGGVYRGLTVSFWWKLSRAVPRNGGFGLCRIGGRRGYIAVFVRGGPWCGLDDSSGIFQVWGFPGVTNVNLFWERHMREKGYLKSGVWRHTAMTILAGRRFQAYVDGVRVADVRPRGRALDAEDALREIVIGGGPYGGAGTGKLVLSDPCVLSRPLDGGTIRDHVAFIQALRAAWGSRLEAQRSLKRASAP